MAISKKKCPLCMGSIRDGVCTDCGYRLPDEEEFERMSSLYDFEPDNYPKPEYEPEPSEMGYDRGMAEFAEPDPPRDLKIKVEDPVPPPPPNYGNNFANGAGGGASPTYYTPGASNGSYVNQPYYVPPPDNNGQGKGRRSNYSVSADDIPWLQILISLLVPFVGIFIGAKMIQNNKNNAVKRGIGIAIIVLSVIRLLF